MSEKLLKDIRKFINANQFIKHSMFMFFFGLEYFCLLTVTLSAKKIIFSRKLKILLFNMKSNRVKDAVSLIFKVDFGIRNEKKYLIFLKSS